MNQRLLLLAVVAAALPAPVLAQSASPRDNINALIEEQAKASGVPSSFIHKVIKRESNYNPNAKGGSALGLMQIKHATARGMGYRGDAAGLYDPATNLRYGIAYLAGAYRTAKGDLTQAYTYYNRGYYYAAKRGGVSTEVSGLGEGQTLGSPTSSAAFGSIFSAPAGLRSTGTDPAASSTVLAYAAVTAAAPTEVVEVPLPPRRPAALGGAALVAEAEPARAIDAAGLAALSVGPQIGAASQAAASAEPAITEMVEVPLPPRRPSATLLAAFGRPIVAKKPAAMGTILEASAIAPNP